MKDLDYNKYIENYIENDKTNSAIMLTGDWGTGKSFYIKNSLIKYLEYDHNRKCVVISLYGLKNISEISKSLFFELKFNFSKNNEQSTPTQEGTRVVAKVIGKTIVKTATDKLGFSFTDKDVDWQELFKSVDLSDKFLVFEDLERSSIPINDILGYVYTLVEEESTKILLVANEKEIIHNIANKNGEYVRIKEKTISDTIVYSCDYYNAIGNIIDNYSKSSDALLSFVENKLSKLDLITSVKSIMDEVGIYNLRSLIFACQKTVDIFSKARKEINKDFFKHVFLSIVAYSLKSKENSNLLWTDINSAKKLGTSKYPLYEFCYDYIKNQKFLEKDLIECEQLFLDSMNFETNQIKVNAALDSIFNFMYRAESEVYEAVKEIKVQLEWNEVIPITQYGKLANYLIAIRSVISGDDLIDKCKHIMLENLQRSEKKNDNTLNSINFHSGISYWEEKQKEEHNMFFKEMNDAVKMVYISEIVNSNPITYLRKTIEFMTDKERNIKCNQAVIANFDLNSILEGLKQADAKIVDEFRTALFYVYRYTNISNELPGDKIALQNLKKDVQNLLENGYWTDKIVKLQLDFLVNNLGEILKYYEN